MEQHKIEIRLRRDSVVRCEVDFEVKQVFKGIRA